MTMESLGISTSALNWKVLWSCICGLEQGINLQTIELNVKHAIEYMLKHDFTMFGGPHFISFRSGSHVLLFCLVEII